MIPFQLATIGAVWSLRTRWSAWLAALVALWPLDAYAWEFKFDLVPAALLAVGLALAYRERFGLAGVVLGDRRGSQVDTGARGARARRLASLVAQGKEVVRHAAGFIVAFAALTLPYLVWDPRRRAGCVLDPGRAHDHRRVPPYLPLHWLGQAELGDDFTQAASVPGWADPAVTVVQIAVARRRARARRARPRCASRAASPSPRSPPLPSCSRTASSARSSSSCCLRAGRSRSAPRPQRTRAAAARGRGCRVPPSATRSSSHTCCRAGSWTGRPSRR